MELNLYYIPSTLIHHYKKEQLDKTDQKRAQQKPHLTSRPSWQSSRLGKYLATKENKNTINCISHSAGDSLIANCAIKAGVDLEEIKTRDFFALAEKVFSPFEITLLEKSQNKAQCFYQLWCIKESLIKAEDLNFPSDMPLIGFDKQGITSPAVKNKQKNYFYLNAIINERFMMAVVWQKSLESCLHIHLPNPPSTTKFTIIANNNNTNKIHYHKLQLPT